MEVIKVAFEKAIDALDHAGYTIERNIWQKDFFLADEIMEDKMREWKEKNLHAIVKI